MAKAAYNLHILKSEAPPLSAGVPETMEVNFPMRLEKARPLVLVHSEMRCGHCLSQRVELAEFETVRYHDHEGEKAVFKQGYFCLDCEQISLSEDGPPEDPSAEPYSTTVPENHSPSGPKTW